MESKAYLNPQAILNIAFYRFVELKNLNDLKAELKDRGNELEIRGSILLSPEGINGFLAGEVEQVRQFFAELSARPEFPNLECKESFSSHVPFKRMIVKLKKEIITMGMPDIHPALDTGSRLEAKELKKWLDEQRDLVLIDTRNTYEIEQGTFNTAVHYDIETFKEFPAELEKRKEELKDKTVVMFCTGGIRCEKSTALAKQMGIEKVFQLEGGILKYFEEVGNAHYKGDCF
ncbi:MAG: sulfurtransferase, partial [Proteobacteria bacterium]